MPKRATSLTGAAGEHYVAFIFSSLGYPVALTRGGSPTIDLMIGDLKGGAAISVQVKTSSCAWRKRVRKPENSHWEWDVKPQKALELRGESIFYAFVDLKEGESKAIQKPDIFIVPSEHVTNRAISDGFGEHPEWNKFMFWIYEHERDIYFEKWELITKKLNNLSAILREG